MRRLFPREGLINLFSDAWFNPWNQRTRLVRDKRLHTTEQRVNLFLCGGIDGVQPVRARQVVLLARLRFDVLNFKWDDDQLAIGSKDKFATYVIGGVRTG